jgi:hypothetical protein
MWIRRRYRAKGVRGVIVTEVIEAFRPRCEGAAKRSAAEASHHAGDDIPLKLRAGVVMAFAGNLDFSAACILAPIAAVFLALRNGTVAGLVGALLFLLFHVSPPLKGARSSARVQTGGRLSDSYVFGQKGARS